MYELDKEAFGRFLAGLRKEKGLTQRQLAERLFVSDKAVSKWERGLSLPDTAPAHPAGRSAGRDGDRAAALPPLSRRRAHRPGHGRARGQGRDPLPRFHPYVQAGVAAAPQGDRLVCRGPGRRGRRRLRQLPAGQPARRNGAAACDHGRRFRRVLLAARAGPPAGLLRREPAGLFLGLHLAYQRPRRGLQQRKLAPHREGAAGLVLPGPGAASSGQSRVGLAVSPPSGPASCISCCFWAACSARFTSPAGHKCSAAGSDDTLSFSYRHAEPCPVGQGFGYFVAFFPAKKPRRHGAGGGGRYAVIFSAGGRPGRLRPPVQPHGNTRGCRGQRRSRLHGRCPLCPLP